MIYADAYIDRWGEVYLSSPVLPSAMRFDAFLIRPRHNLALFHDHQALPDTEDFLPLLPQQIAVQQRLDAAERKSS